MCDRVSTGLKDAAVENGPIPLGAPRPRNAHEGPWNGLYPAGYKLVRRAPHAHRLTALSQRRADQHAAQPPFEAIRELAETKTQQAARLSQLLKPKSEGGFGMPEL